MTLKSKRRRLLPIWFGILAGLAVYVPRMAAGQSTPPQTVFVIVMENTSWADIHNNPAAPYINSLLPLASRAEQYFTPPGVHPSAPNYFWLEAGQDFGLAGLTSYTPAANHQATTSHLTTLLRNAGIPWKAYQESIDGTQCPIVDQYPYMTKHDPFVFFDDVTNTNNAASAYCIAHVRPYSELGSDLVANTVARYNFITPNMCDDMHDCGIAAGDSWLSAELPKILNSQAYKNDGVVFLTWDEGGAATPDGPLGMIVLSPAAKGGGYSNAIHYTHSSLLRTIQEILGVAPLLGDAANATDLSDLFSSFPSTGGTPGGTLPAPWQTSDIGSVGPAGSASYSAGTFTIQAAGSNIWGTADAFRFTYESSAGDTQLVARVASLQNTSVFAKAGLMLRDTLDPASAHVVLDVKPDGGIEFMQRASAGGSTTFLGGTTVGVPAWLRLSRSGSTVTGAVSTDGSTWTTVGSTTVGATGGLAGLAVTSQTTSLLTTARLDSVAITAPASGGPNPGGTTAGDVVLYAADAAASDIHGSWSTAADSTAAAGVKLVSRDTGVANTGNALASPVDYVDLSFNAVAGIPYRFWLRMQALSNSKYNDSVWVQFSGATVNSAPAYAIGSTSGLLVNLANDSTGSGLSGWGWQNGAYWLSQSAAVTFSTSGTHTIRIQVREDGVEFDQVVLSPSTYFNAAPGPAANDTHIVAKSTAPSPAPGPANVVVYASDLPASALHGWSTAADSASPSGVKIVTADSGWTATAAPLASPSSYVDVTFSANAGVPYAIWLRLRALNDSKYNDSVWVQFSDAQANSAPAYPINSTSGLLVNLATDSTGASLSGWGWQNGAYWVPQATTVSFATTGTHTMRIQVREDGVQLDQIVLSPTTYLTAAPGRVSNDSTIVPR